MKKYLGAALILVLLVLSYKYFQMGVRGGCGKPKSD